MNIEIKKLNGETALLNWNNVTSVEQPENYLMNQVGDLGSCLQVNFTDKKILYTKETIEDIKQKLRLN